MSQRLTPIVACVGAIAFLMLAPGMALAAAPPLQHTLEVRLDPASGTLNVQDRMTLPDGESEWPVLLHTGLDPQVIQGDADLIAESEAAHLTRYRLRRRASGPVTLSYGGRIRHGLARLDEGMGRARQWSLGTIDPEGVVLDGNSGWYPRIPDRLHTFRLQVQLPAGWMAVSQGAGPGSPETGVSAWSETQPQDDIYLIAGPFRLYRKPAEGFEAQVYLRQADDALARTYLAATAKYVALYSHLIGLYPFAKFALVENFWETGYGMPSFTLLGPSVIRLPFIVETSYPHEILHNWWGNSVYIDETSGNWSEGLTNYLADHWLKEQAGQGAEYRRDILKGFADYVRDGQDFPLTEFRGRHGSASQAIGYGKGAMVFHMLRKQLGDERFNQGLRRFYADNRFRAARYADLQAAFEAVSGRDLGDFVTAWTTRPGAPRLAVTDVRLIPSGTAYRITGRIEQTQSAPPFPLQVPVAIHRQGSDATRLIVESDERSTPFDIAVAGEPERLAVDPDFDVFRELLPGETPITLGNFFGADRGLILLPSAAPAPLLDAYRHLAERWRQGHPEWRLQLDREVAELPDDRPVWLLGWENRYLGRFAAEAHDFALDSAARRLQLGDIATDDSASLVLTRWRGNQPLAWLATDDPAALPALARKLPHYGKYSYLSFAGPEAVNRLKGQWPSGASALVHWFEVRPRVGCSISGVCRRSVTVQVPRRVSCHYKTTACTYDS